MNDEYISLLAKSLLEGLSIEKYIEKIAREKFKMVKPGERVFKVSEQ